jgi:hypothetical protein
LVLESLRITNNANVPYLLTRVNWEDAERDAVPAVNVTSNPDRYAVRGEYVRLLVIPNATYTLYWSGLFQPTPITIASSDSATNAWMTKGAELVRNYAKMMVARDTLVDADRATSALAAMQMADDDLIAENTKRQHAGIRPWGARMRVGIRAWGA